MNRLQCIVMAKTVVLLAASNLFMTLSQLKILQEAISLTVFVPFVVLYMRQPLKLDYLYAALCIIGAVYFMFRS